MYTVEQAWQFAESWPALTTIGACSELELRLLLADVPEQIGGLSLVEFLDLERAEGLSTIFLDMVQVDACFAGGYPFLLREVPLRARIMQHDFVPDHPKLSSLRRWRREDVAPSAEFAVPPPNEEPRPPPDPMVDVPTKGCEGLFDEEAWQASARVEKAQFRKRRLDPVKVVDALTVCSHLKSPKYFKDVLQATADYERKATEETEERDDLLDPSRSKLEKDRARLDAVACCLTRREFETWMANDELEAINLFSDSSPVVGAELQGMVMDVHTKHGGYRRITMPGSTLTYGHFDWISKTMALVWSCFLLVGCRLPILSWFFEHVVSVTTDYGTELKSATMSNILPALVRWVNVASLSSLHDYVVGSERLMPRALRIGGWSHSLGNMMKDHCCHFPCYPQWLGHLRALCAFFRNETFRQHLMRIVRAPGLNLKKALKTFTAGLAKWRYETLPDALWQLGKLRTLCEQHLRRELFGEVQDEGFLTSVLNACRDKAFWRWVIAANKFVFWPLEKVRRWGMVCACHEEERRDNPTKKFSCQFDSRRLAEAWQKIQDERVVFTGSANNLTEEDTEGDKQLWKCIVDCLRAIAVDFQVRFQYLSSLPWAFCRASDQAVAAQCIAAFESRPLHEHDAVTRNFMARLGPDLQINADTGSVTEALQREINAMNTAPLDESAGEGYHRATHHTRVRASGAKLPYIKAATRFKENIAGVRRYIQKYKGPGRAAFRFDWARYKRLLQTKSSLKWQPKRMKPRAFFERMYRMDEMSLEDWSPLVVPTEPFEPGRARRNDNDRLATEWAQAVLKRGEYYSLQRTVEVLGEDGQQVEEQRTEFFQLVKVHVSRSRTRVIRTVDSKDDPSQSEQIALCMQPMAQWQERGTPEEPNQLVYADADSSWGKLEDFGDFHHMTRHLQQWRTVGPCDIAGCHSLTNATRAEPAFVLTDAACPTYCVIRELRRRGWRTVTRKVIHTRDNLDTLILNNNGGPRIKYYLQCLLDLEAKLALTSCIPTHEPQGFYKCLLEGRVVEPGLGKAAYQLVLKGDEPGEAPPIGDADVEVQGALADGEEIMGRGRAKAKPKAKAKAKVAAVPLPGVGGFSDDEESGDDEEVGHPEPPPPKAKAASKPKAKPKSSAKASAIGAFDGGGPPPAKAPAKAPPPPAKASGPIVAVPKALPPPAKAHLEEAGEEVIARGAPVAKRAGLMARDNFIDAVGDGTIVRQDYAPAVAPSYSNWIIRFRYMGRSWERKRHVTPDHTRIFGEIEPIAFLHAKKARICAGDPEFLHNARAEPSPAQVAEQVAAHRAAFNDILVHFAGEPSP